MVVTVNWTLIQGPDDPRWQDNCGLYAYLTMDGEEILYLGKMDGCTVRERWRAPDKRAFWDALEKERRVFRHLVIVGDIHLQSDGSYSPRLTRQMVADVESLLIYKVQPWGNIACTKSRTSRPGMFVTCEGAWPPGRWIYVDDTEVVPSGA
jgi:hypothetical protein